MSVYAAKLVEAIEVDIHALRGMLRFHDDRIIQERLAFLKSVPLLANFSRGQLLSLLKKATMLEFNRYQYLFREGQVSKSLFLVKEGEFKVSKQLVFNRDGGLLNSPAAPNIKRKEEDSKAGAQSSRHP